MDDKKDNSAATNNNLLGTIPQEIFLLSNLKYLNLDNQFFTGTIPFGIGKATQFGELHLAGNSVGGMIPTKIHQLNLLSVFDAGENQLTGPLPSGIFVSMTSLRQLRLDKNDLSGTTSPPIVLSELEQLELQNNELIGEIPALPRTLTFCNLSSNMLQVVNASVCEV